MAVLMIATCSSTAFDEIGVRSVAIEHGAVHGEIGGVDLQD